MALSERRYDADVEFAPAVFVRCSRCHAMSQALNPNEAEAWTERHARRHEVEDRRDRLAAQGHDIAIVDRVDGLRRQTVRFGRECDPTNSAGADAGCGKRYTRRTG